jgi:hypothetical protein
MRPPSQLRPRNSLLGGSASAARATNMAAGAAKRACGRLKDPATDAGLQAFVPDALGADGRSNPGPTSFVLRFR